jgi:Undecaprenyl-phosphate galactose phosphotransferase WbaP
LCETMIMAQADTVASRPTNRNRDESDWHQHAEALRKRFRRLIVVGSLVIGDLVTGLVALTVSKLGLSLLSDLPIEAQQLPVTVLILIFFCVRLYTGCGPSPYERFRLRTIGILCFVVLNLLIALSSTKLGPLLVMSFLQGVLLLVSGHYTELLIRAVLIRLDLWGAPTALVGCNCHNKRLAHLLLQQPALGLNPVGFVTVYPELSPDPTVPLSVIGTSRHPLAAQSRIEVAIFSSAEDLAKVTGDNQEWMSSCEVLLLEDVHDLQSLWLRTRMLGFAVGIEIRRDLWMRHKQLIKRLIDVVFAIPLALLAWPIIAVLGLAIKIVDPGPAFYAQERIGRNGKTLQTLKLRTMYADAEQRLDEHLCKNPQARVEWERYFKLSDDPRVLPIIGHFMRRTSLDELPQLWNVIRGDMALVGPRPFPAYHLESFDQEFRMTRASVFPGITGMWQVSSRSDGDLEVQRAQDLFYIRNWSIWLDIYILLQTVVVVVSGRGAK